jgi:RNA polymerase sigma-70 factor, ECF subfamily
VSSPNFGRNSTPGRPDALFYGLRRAELCCIIPQTPSSVDHNAEWRHARCATFAVDRQSIESYAPVRMWRERVTETDSELIRQAIDGDHSAFGQLVDRYSAAVACVVGNLVRRKDDVEDVVQECFIRAYQALGSFRQDSSFRTWLFRIAHNTAITRSTQQVRRSETFVGEGAQSPGAHRAHANRADDHEAHDYQAHDYEANDPLPDDVLEAKDLEHRLARHIDALPAHYREALMLYYYQEQSYKEMAEILDKPINTVKAHMRRAKAQLKKLLASDSAMEEWQQDDR